MLDGQNGVYAIRVDSVGTTPVTTGDIAEQRKNLYQQTKQFISNPQSPAYPVNALKKAATIKDKGPAAINILTTKTNCKCKTPEALLIRGFFTDVANNSPPQIVIFMTRFYYE